MSSKVLHGDTFMCKKSVGFPVRSVWTECLLLRQGMCHGFHKVKEESADRFADIRLSLAASFNVTSWRAH